MGNQRYLTVSSGVGLLVFRIILLIILNLNQFLDLGDVNELSCRLLSLLIILNLNQFMDLGDVIFLSFLAIKNGEITAGLSEGVGGSQIFFSLKSFSVETWVKIPISLFHDIGHRLVEAVVQDSSTFLSLLSCSRSSVST